jgi:hypothetical protein
MKIHRVETNAQSVVVWLLLLWTLAVTMRHAAYWGQTSLGDTKSQVALAIACLEVVGLWLAAGGAVVRKHRIVFVGCVVAMVAVLAAAGWGIYGDGGKSVLQAVWRMATAACYIIVPAVSLVVMLRR